MPTGFSPNGRKLLPSCSAVSDTRFHCPSSASRLLRIAAASEGGVRGFLPRMDEEKTFRGARRGLSIDTPGWARRAPLHAASLCPLHDVPVVGDQAERHR